MVINIHTHHPKGEAHLKEVENLRPGISASGKTAFFSVGLHPWFLQEDTFESDLNWLEQHAYRPEVLAVGEAGLDKICATPMELQLLAFEACAEIAEQCQKPLIIHCVRAHSEVYQCKQLWRPKQPWILHGFDKHLQTAAMFEQAGFYFSFGKALFHENSHAAETLRATAPDRIFVETDDAAELEIAQVYERAAQCLGLDSQQFSEQIQRNFESVFMSP
ncbi:MAG: TatD family hydrolase, partial [Saprospiraceae bacterium]|nr:TatD family hydrolase [Saprospiraceae bacterium]